MERTNIRNVAILVLALEAACSGGGGDGGPPCGPEEFLCLDHCQALGTTCGAPDGGPNPDGGEPPDAGDPDAAPDEPDAGDPCAPRPHGDGQAPVHSYCRDESTVVTCDGHESPCNASFPSCQEWYEPLFVRFEAACLGAGNAPCDPELEPSRCAGPLQVWCNTNLAYPDFGPPGLQVEVDCRDRYGDDALCEVRGELLGCTSATAERCDVESFVPACSDDGEGIQTCAQSDGLVFDQACLEGWRCLDNPLTRLTELGVACIPDPAVPSDADGTTTEQGLACEGDAVIRLEQYGWEWSQACLEGDVCYDGPPPRCESPSTEHCDADGFVPYCSDDGAAELRCGGLWSDTLQRVDCLPVGKGLCDPLDGACVPSLPCTAADPARCAAGNRYRLTCDGDIGWTVAEPCPDCYETGPGEVVCGGA